MTTRQQNDILLAKNERLIYENNDLENEKAKKTAGNLALEKQQQELQKEIEGMAGSKAKLERNVRSYDEDDKWQLPEAGMVQTAKAYREKSALPLVNKLKGLVKSFTIQCVQLTEQVRKLTEKVKKQTADIEHYKEKIGQMNERIEQLYQRTEDLERVKRYTGADKIQEMIDSVKEVERLQNQQKRLQRNYNNRFSR